MDQTKGRVRAMSEYGIEDEALVFRDEKTFFQIVQTTPDWVEAEDLLQRARTAAIRCKAMADKRDDIRAMAGYAALLTRINVELKTVHRKQSNTMWCDAVRALYGPEGVDQCLLWMGKKRKEAA